MDGKELRRIRGRLGLTQAEFGDLVGVHKNTVAKWERDEQGIRPSVVKLIRLLAAGRKPR